jgi:hypothetical protein
VGRIDEPPNSLKPYKSVNFRSLFQKFKMLKVNPDLVWDRTAIYGAPAKVVKTAPNKQGAFKSSFVD